MTQFGPEFYVEGRQENVLNFDLWKHIVFDVRRAKCEVRELLEPTVYPVSHQSLPLAVPHLRLVDVSYDPYLGYTDDYSY